MKLGEHDILKIMKMLRSASLRSNFTILLVLTKKKNVSIYLKDIYKTLKVVGNNQIESELTFFFLSL